MTAADRKWIRRMMREEVAKLAELVLANSAQQLGGYDGATSGDWDHWEEEARRHRRPIGFITGSAPKAD